MSYKYDVSVTKTCRPVNASVKTSEGDDVGVFNNFDLVIIILHILFLFFKLTLFTIEILVVLVLSRGCHATIQ